MENIKEGKKIFDDKQNSIEMKVISYALILNYLDAHRMRKINIHEESKLP